MKSIKEALRDQKSRTGPRLIGRQDVRGAKARAYRCRFNGPESLIPTMKACSAGKPLPEFTVRRENEVASPALYWKGQATGTLGVSFSDLLQGAKQVMQNSGLTSIKKSSVDVSGRTPNCHAAMTFVDTGSSFVLIIMVAGIEAKVVRDKLSSGF
jgi:hypothetical protein